MIRKSLLMVAAFAIALGPARAAGLPEEVLVATAIDRPAVHDISSTPSLASADVKPAETIIVAQAVLPGLRPPHEFRPPADNEKALFDLNLLALVSLNVADYVTTRQALKYPGLYEANPMMRPFAKSPAVFTAVKAGTTILSYLGMRALFKKNRTAAWVVTTATNLFLSYAVSSNLQKIHQARGL